MAKKKRDRATMIAVSTLVIVLLIAVATFVPGLLPERVGSTELSCWNMKQSADGGSIPDPAWERERDSQGFIVHKGFGPTVCYNMRTYVSTAEHDYFCSDAIWNDAEPLDLALLMDIGNYKGTWYTKTVYQGETLWHQCTRTLKNGDKEFWVYKVP